MVVVSALGGVGWGACRANAAIMAAVMMHRAPTPVWGTKTAAPSAIADTLPKTTSLSITTEVVELASRAAPYWIEKLAATTAKDSPKATGTQSALTGLGASNNPKL